MKKRFKKVVEWEDKGFFFHGLSVFLLLLPATMILATILFFKDFFDEFYKRKVYWEEIK